MSNSTGFELANACNSSKELAGKFDRIALEKTEK